jgi:hypothetical protein
MGSYVRLVAATVVAGLIVNAAISGATMSGVLAQAPDQPATYFGVTFPVEIGGGRRVNLRDDETANPGLGYSAGYQHRGATSTVYIYGGPQRIPDDVHDLMVTGHFNMMRRDFIRARAPGSVQDTGHFEIADSAQRPRLVCDGYIIQNGGGTPGAPPEDSFVCLGVVNGKFFMVRTSMPRRPDAEAEVRRFVQAWVDLLWSK